jgi:hypothetical protein
MSTTTRHGLAAVILGLMLSSGGCATGINSPTAPVLISSEPMGAKVVVDDRFYTTTPGKVRLSRLSPHIVRVEKEGYEPAKIEIDRGMSWWVLADLSCLLWIVSCVSKDMEEGGFYTLDKEVHVTLTKSATVLPAVSVEPAPPPTPTALTVPLEAAPAAGKPSAESSEPLAETSPPASDAEPSVQTAPEPGSESAPEPSENPTASGPAPGP